MKTMTVPPGNLQLFAVTGLLMFAPFSVRAGIQGIGHFSSVGTTACENNANPPCDLQQGSVNKPTLGPHSVMRSSSITSPTGGASAAATSNTNATYNASTGVLDFTGNLFGNASADNQNPLDGASNGRGRGSGSVDGSYTGSYRFTVTGNMAIQSGRNNLGFFDNNCRVLIRVGDNDAVVFEQSLERQGNGTLSGSGTLPPGLGGLHRLINAAPKPLVLLHAFGGLVHSSGGLT